MRPWLYNLLLNEDVLSVKWESKRESTFRIAWRHAARQGWNLRDDADLTWSWNEEKPIIDQIEEQIRKKATKKEKDDLISRADVRKFMDGDDPDPKRWKANFRCALNSLPDVEELKDRGLRKGNNAFKIYKFLDEKKMKLKRKQNNQCRETESSPKRASKRLQDKPCRRFADSESDEDEEEMSEDSDECQSPRRRDSDEVSTSGSEPELISERYSRFSTDSNELPVFEKICGESDLSIFKPENKCHNFTYNQGYITLPDTTMAIYNTQSDDDNCSTESDMTEEELVELILNVESPGAREIVEIKDEPIDIWSSVAADVTIGEDMDQDLLDGCVINETENVVTQQITFGGDMGYTCLDLSLI
ncbi:IRF2 [Mytilus edulis]|uniref:IRF2 n=1 Tax=Mytilus edulis TaxID=6550 RepID=A0A8S3TJ57_MYTED|nr:IRF2 [Mytilus edulis]